MNHFSIRDIENLCGVKAHTLRIWEQRYNFFVPKRKRSQHRIYDCNDLKELLRISYLYHNGYKISRIAELTPEQIKEEVASIKPQCCSYELYVLELIEASVDLDKERFEKVINNLVLRLGLDKCIVHVFYPLLQRIGFLWMTNHVIPAQEHFCSHIIRKKIICAIDGLEQPVMSNTNVVIFSPPGELHEIPLLVVHYLLRKNGIRTTYFGTNVSLDSLRYYQACHSFSHLYMHVITHLDNCGISQSVKEMQEAFPGIPLIVSGPACHCISKSPDVQYLQNVEELTSFTDSIIKK